MNIHIREELLNIQATITQLLATLDTSVASDLATFIHTTAASYPPGPIPSGQFLQQLKQQLPKLGFTQRMSTLRALGYQQQRKAAGNFWIRPTSASNAPVTPQPLSWQPPTTAAPATTTPATPAA